MKKLDCSFGVRLQIAMLSDFIAPWILRSQIFWSHPFIQITSMAGTYHPKFFGLFQSIVVGPLLPHDQIDVWWIERIGEIIKDIQWSQIKDVSLSFSCLSFSILPSNKCTLVEVCGPLQTSVHGQNKH